MIKVKKIYDENNIYQNIGNNLKKLYSKISDKNYKNKTDKLEMVSSEIGISASFLQHIINGTNKNQRPSLPTLVAICNYFEINIDELLKDNNQKG